MRTPDGEIRDLEPREIGVLGENLAALHLEREERMKVLHRNFRAPHGGEVDLICRDRDVLAFIEVKTRTTEKYGRPSDAVNKDKQALIARGAMHWLRLLDHPDIHFRFDIAEVVLEDGELPRFNLIREAFQLPDWCRY